MSLRRVALVGATLVVAVVGVVLTAVPAQAHDDLRGVTPADGASVTQAPAAVVLEFSDDVQPLGSAVVVRGSDGTVVSDGSPAVSGRTVTQALRPIGADGEYQVSFRVVSADGHPVSGSTRFTAVGIGPAMTASSSAQSGARQVGEAREIHPGVWVGVGLVTLLVVVLAVGRRRRRTVTG